MDQTYVSDLPEKIGEQVVLKGWLYNSRSSGKLVFLQLRDGTGIVQCIVFKGNVEDDVFEAAKALGQESSLIVKGSVKEDARSPIGVEVDVTDVEVVQSATDYPITPKEHGTEFLMDHRHLWIRSKLQHAVLRVRHTVIKATRDYFDDNGFILADTPIFTPAACEGTTTLFEVDYFDDNKAYLTQSGQLYNEATAAAFGKSYAFGPTFRAEKSKTRRHLTEFWMVEPEVAYAHLEDMMDLGEGLILAIVSRVLEERKEELETLERDVSKLEAIESPFPRIHYDEAVKMLQKGHDDGELESRFEWGGDFGAPDETYLSQQFGKPVFVHHFPATIKAFYFEKDKERPELALGVDLLAPEGYGEIIGGGERATDIDYLEKQIEEHNLPKESFEWYLDLRRYGSVPHAGFGMGIERCTAWMCGIEHIRETIPFPRMLYRLRP
ncbi:MAG: asparagine--tRNA ligase [Acidobacteria bacterium]|nr:MAG: asparagine--tRNA ligase [Acidobacteriota bacterium]REK01520.1 MAG: asparagine--tRNA ligase [Acidobacteriota bacterium]REK14476.1 MAG: asparagine--tRNA ligase [Acidobacteriota bacterium]REK45191.1 MAG: asparagine--tRNA ligase [Acidobacteriota bacterium]